VAKLITIDFETFYDTDYSLTKLSTEEYVNDDRFEVIGFAYKIDNEPAVFTGHVFPLARMAAAHCSASLHESSSMSKRLSHTFAHASLSACT